MLQPDFENIPDENLQFSIEDLFLELLLMKIREMTIPYSGKLTREREREMKTFLDGLAKIR